MSSDDSLHGIHHRHAADTEEVKVKPKSEHSKQIVVEVGEVFRGCQHCLQYMKYQCHEDGPHQE